MLAFPSSSRCPPRPRGVNLKDEVRKNLFQEVRNCTRRDAPLTDELKAALLGLDEADRREIVNSHDEDDCTPLFHAARMGNIAVAQFLVEDCGADLEIKGTLDTFSESRPHTATPLWVASVYGGLKMVQYLLSKNAYVNTTSNSRSTPVRSACFMSNKLVVQALVEAGADIRITNQCGGSCLTNAVQCLELLEYLLQQRNENGERLIDVNVQDYEGNTALHYAVLERRLEASKLLVENGANIFLSNMFGQSALQLAAHKGDLKIVEYLQTTTQISAEDEANLLEMMGANALSNGYSGDTQKALENFKKAAEIRERTGIQKQMLDYYPPYACLTDATTGEVYSRIQEHTTVAQWQTIQDNLQHNRRRDDLQIQQLLISERQLGVFHKDFLKKLDKCTKELESARDNFFYQEAIKFYALQLHCRKDQNGLLYYNAAKALQSLVEVYMDWYHHRKKMDRDGFSFVACPFELLMKTFRFLMEQLAEVLDQLISTIKRPKPFLPSQRTCYDVYILACSKIIYLLLNDPIKSTEGPPKVPFRSKEQMLEICKGIEYLASNALPVFSTGDTLLHLAVRRFGDSNRDSLIPNLQYVEFLVQLDADVNAVNFYGETPLHILLKDKNYTEDEIAELLVKGKQDPVSREGKNGTHLDHYDHTNFCPLQKLLEKPYPGFSTNPPLILQCMAAKFVGQFPLSYYAHDLPKHLVDSVIRHAKIDTCAREKHKLYEKLYHYDP